MDPLFNYNFPLVLTVVCLMTIALIHDFMQFFKSNSEKMYMAEKNTGSNAA